MKIMICMIVNQ